MNYYLDKENNSLVDRINSADSTQDNYVYIGPTRVSFDMLDKKKAINNMEAPLFKQWKEKDLASYYRQIVRNW